MDLAKNHFKNRFVMICDIKVINDLNKLQLAKEKKTGRWLPWFVKELGLVGKVPRLKRLKVGPCRCRL